MSIYEKLKKDYKLAVRGELGYESKNHKERLTGDRKERAHDPDFLRRTLEEEKNDGRWGFRFCVIIDADNGSEFGRIFDPELIKLFVELEKAGRQAEFFGDPNETIYLRVMKFRRYVESDKPIDQELLLATQRRMKDFESWFIRHGFEVPPEFVEIVENDEEKSQVPSDENWGTEFRHSDYRTIIYKGIEYHVTRNQGRAIEILDKAREPVSKEKILTPIYGVTSGNKSVRKIFEEKKEGKNVMSPLWRTLVVEVRRGLYKLSAYSVSD